MAWFASDRFCRRDVASVAQKRRFANSRLKVKFEFCGFLAITKRMGRFDHLRPVSRCMQNFTSIVFCPSSIEVFGQADLSPIRMAQANKTVNVMKFHGLACPGVVQKGVVESGYSGSRRIRRDRLRGCNKLLTKPGGEGGIRTLGAVSSTRPFQGRTIGHSVTSPSDVGERTNPAASGQPIICQKKRAPLLERA